MLPRGHVSAVDVTKEGIYRSMPSSRITLSLLALFVATMATLGWTALGQPVYGSVMVDSPRAHYVICGLTLFSALSRPRGVRYLICSRLLLSALSCVFGACLTLLLMDSVSLLDARSPAVSRFQFWIYIGAASIAAVVWAASYHRSQLKARRDEFSIKPASR